MSEKTKSLIKDIVAFTILVIFMFFVVKGVPKLFFGGATDANGNPLVMAAPSITYTVESGQ